MYKRDAEIETKRDKGEGEGEGGKETRIIVEKDTFLELNVSKH